MPEYTVTRHVETLVDTIKMCILNPDTTIENCMRPIARDLDDIWGWNHLLPPVYNFCMHDMISEQARRSPDKIAISSWDGSLTYTEVEQYSSFLASSFRDMGVKLHDVLPLCFEKSRWTIVAVLAVMKVGATIVLMDPTLPLARLQNMAEQVNAKMMVTSRKQQDLSSSIIPGGKFFVVEADTFVSSNSQVTPTLADVPASALMYIIFTSGSTGTPKGVKISHKAYTSSAIPRARAVGYDDTSRVLDFASYAFDVSIDSMLLTLGNGGCLCIPSDEDRLNDINQAIRSMQINYAGLTPSLARILDADVISSLSALGLGGEAVSARDVSLWGRDTRIVIGYGPCECTIGCTINSSAATGRDYISIGGGNGGAMWIVDPNDHEFLVPVGAVGELLVEGPIVGQGYLNDAEKTADSFIEDPSWLIAGHKGYSGRRGRLYKSGDLGKYDPDGSGGIVFVGRKDSQVKIRGQRVELGEIESQLKARLPLGISVIAEVIAPVGSGSQPTLVAFLSSRPKDILHGTDLKTVPLEGGLRGTLSKANEELAKVLPRYMVPTSYIPVNFIPVLVSSKTDRKRLRLFGATVDLRKLDQGTTNTPTRQLSDLEQRLRHAWGQVLKLNTNTIKPDDNFFALGGDSLAAMKLVSACRAQGLDLSVASTFGHPTLSAMAGAVHVSSSQARTEAPPFSMISRDVESACVEAALACRTERAAIEDIYPSTPTQESLFTFSIKSIKTYIAQRVACIPSHLSLDAWKDAWETVIAASSILRTRLAQLQEPGLLQVVIKESISWRHAIDLAQYLENDRTEKMELGQSLARYAIVENSCDGKRYMVWTVHHVLYDGWSEPLILKEVSNVLQGQHVETQAIMKDFVKYVHDTDKVAMQNYWRQELKGAIGPQFPRLPFRDYLPTPDAMLEHQIFVETETGSPFTMATLIRGAWALVASQYTRSDDVVFGETLTGRDITLPGVENIVGPLIATLPVRIRVDRASSVESYLQIVQQGMLGRNSYQHMGWQNIRKVSQDAQHASEAPTGLVIQPESDYVGSELGFEQGDVVREALHFNPYPLMLACGVRKGGFRVCASFDSSLIEVKQMERIFAQLETAYSQLSKNRFRRIDEISCLPEAELNQIWQWNQISPLSWNESSRSLRANAGIKQGSIYPPAVIPWVCDPQNPSLLSPIGCVGELWLEGEVLSGESTESPAWLVAGSSNWPGRTGKTQRTGDIVQLREDGSLIFIRRRENVLAVQGHAIDLADLEMHLAQHLPQTNRAAAALSQEQELVVFVEHQPSDEDDIELLSPKHDITRDISKQQSTETRIIPIISINLVEAIRKFDKFVKDSLPSYMTPFAYVVVEKTPSGMEQIDRSALNQAASGIPRQILAQLREGFKKAWTKSSVHTKLSAPEDILRSSWAKILGIRAEQIDVDDNFFRLGGDSVLAMKLVTGLRKQGHTLTVANIFQNMRLSDAAKVLKVDHAVLDEKAQPYKPFSTLGLVDLIPFLVDIVRPKLADPNWAIQDVALVTDSQGLDIRATIEAPRTSVQYTMLYFDKDIVREQLIRACNDLVRAHEILRTVFIEHESAFFQIVLDDLNNHVITHQADKDLEQYVNDICQTDAEVNSRLGSSFLKMLLVEGSNGQKCLIIKLSHSQYDGESLPRLLHDLDASYSGRKIDESESLPSYIARIHNETTQTKAISYWRTLLKNSSLSALERTPTQSGDKSIFQSKHVEISQRPEEITTAALLTAAWGLVLARRLQISDLTFGGITSGRNIDGAYMENVMGPCYQFTPVRIPFRSKWTVLDLLQFVQRQIVESAAYDFLGFEKISKKCTQWSSEAEFFDSIVHYQDIIEEHETIPFANGTCRVEILNPHGYSAHPLKVVSFVRGGQTHFGVVGNERDPAFVDRLLDELVATIKELGDISSKHVLLDGKIFSSIAD
jgi:amino acid adenylation domain-containing protein